MVSDVIVTSCKFAPVIFTVCAKPLPLSTPMSALYPKNHLIPFLTECASESRFFSAFFIEDGADIIVESTMVPFSRSDLSLLAFQPQILFGT